MDKAMLDGVKYHYAKIDAHVRLPGLFEQMDIKPATACAVYGDAINDAWDERAKEWLQSSGYVEIDINGYKEAVPLCIGKSENACPGFVYIITDGYSVKIGKSCDLEKRISQIQTGNPRRIVLLQSIETDDMDQVEGSLHYWYARFRRSGEWFDLLPLFGLDPSDCIEIALGSHVIRHEYVYSINIATGEANELPTKFWIREPKKTKAVKAGRRRTYAED